MHFSIITNNFEVILKLQNIKGDRPVNSRKHMPLVINMKTNKKQKLRHNQTSASVMSNSSEELKNLNLPFFKRRPREQFMSANPYSTLSALLILVRASFSRSYLPLVKTNWTEISDLCFLALYTFVLGIKPLNLTIIC